MGDKEFQDAKQSVIVCILADSADEIKKLYSDQSAREYTMVYFADATWDRIMSCCPFVSCIPTAVMGDYGRPMVVAALREDVAMCLIRAASAYGLEPDVVPADQQEEF